MVVRGPPGVLDSFPGVEDGNKTKGTGKRIIMHPSHLDEGEKGIKKGNRGRE